MKDRIDNEGVPVETTVGPNAPPLRSGPSDQGANVPHALPHTPGPWTAERCRLDGVEWFVRSECKELPPFDWKSRFAAHLQPLSPVSGKYIKAHNGAGESDNGCCDIAIRENAANARLIAAAPTQHTELLRYLPIIERAEADPELWARLTEGTGIATANGYRAAIAKATTV